MLDLHFLHNKLEQRREINAYRELRLPAAKIDLCSNDYLGIVKNDLLTDAIHLQSPVFKAKTGSTGSRLLAGNYKLIEDAEILIAAFHEAETGLIYNSGYDANVGILSCIADRGDTILYDYLSHASIRDGIRLSFAHAYSFRHNDLDDLELKLNSAQGRIFVVTESVFSMDGGTAPLQDISILCERYKAFLIVDEAHATGIIGERGEGLVQNLGLQKKCFARVHTFGKALGCHGAIILGDEILRNYLINFSRPFIYSTAMPAAAVFVIKASYELFPLLNTERNHLKNLIAVFRSASSCFAKLDSETPIQAVVIPGNAAVKTAAKVLQDNNFDVRPILYPTVPKDSERLRIVLHSFNTKEELENLMQVLNCN